MKISDKLKSKLTGSAGGVSGGLGFAGSSFPICHSICQGAIAFLAIFGVQISNPGPLMFLQDYTVYFWSVAFAFLFFGIYMYKKKCMSDKLIMFNSGLVIAGLPFASAGAEPFLWVIGGAFVIISISLFVHDKWIKPKQPKSCCEHNVKKMSRVKSRQLEEGEHEI